MANTKTVTFTYVKTDGNGAAIYRVPGARGTVYVSASLFAGDACPETISVVADFAEPKAEAKKLTAEEIEAKAKKLNDQKAKLEAKLAKLNAKLAPTTPVPAADLDAHKAEADAMAADKQ